MELLAQISLVVIAVVMVFLSVFLVAALGYLKRIGSSIAEFAEKVSRELEPLAHELRHLTEDLQGIARAGRYQAGLISSLGKVAPLLIGVYKGVRYFLKRRA